MVAQSKGELPLAHVEHCTSPPGSSAAAVTGMRALLPFWSTEGDPQSLPRAALVTQSAGEQRFQGVLAAGSPISGYSQHPKVLFCTEEAPSAAVIADAMGKGAATAAELICTPTAACSALLPVLPAGTSPCARSGSILPAGAAPRTRSHQWV